MAEARPKDKSWEAQRAAILEKVPNVPLPFQMGPGVSSTVGTREILDQLVPRTDVDMLISSLPLGKLFAMAPDPLKRQMISMLRKGENKTRIAKKMLEGNPALGKAAEALMLFTGKKGGLPSRGPDATNIEELSKALDTLYARGQDYKLSPQGVPEVDVSKAPYSNPAVAAGKAAAAVKKGLPREAGGMLKNPDLPMSRAPADVLEAYRERGEYATAPGVYQRQSIGSYTPPSNVDISDMDKMNQILKVLLGVE